MMLKRVLLFVVATSTLMLAVMSVHAAAEKGLHRDLATGVTQSTEPKSRTEAVALIEGNEFSAASAGGWPNPTPDHWHSDDTDFQGVGTDWMEVGECCGDSSNEEVRAMAEFDLAFAGTVDNATVSFEVIQLSGLFGQTSAGDFLIQLVTYQGDYAEGIDDYTIAASPEVTSFMSSGLTVGQYFNIDVTSYYNAAVAAAAPGFGIRLQAVTDPGGAAVVFGNATLGLATNPPLPPQEAPVPVNTPMALMLLLLLVLAAGFVAVRRRSVS